MNALDKRLKEIDTSIDYYILRDRPISFIDAVILTMEGGKFYKVNVRRKTIRKTSPKVFDAKGAIKILREMSVDGKIYNVVSTSMYVSADVPNKKAKESKEYVSIMVDAMLIAKKLVYKKTKL